MWRPARPGRMEDEKRTETGHTMKKLTARLIRHYADMKKRRNETVYCLQVGANDGRTRDPLHEYARFHAWQCILAEPQAEVFRNELSRTYAGMSNVRLEQVALDEAERDGMDLHLLSFCNERWATGLATFDREVLQKHIDSGYVDRKAAEHRVRPPANRDAYIKTVKVPVTTASVLLEKHGFARLDALFIDTEGHDFKLLRSLDWNRYRPELVLYECLHLSRSDRSAARKLMRALGYRVCEGKQDALAVRFAPPFSLNMRLRLRALAPARRLRLPRG